MGKKILLLKGTSNADVLRVAADYTANGFIKRGYKVISIDVTEKDFQKQLQNAVKETYSFVFAMQGVFINLVINGDPFHALIKSSYYIGWIFDDVMYHYGRLLDLTTDDNDTTTIFSVDNAICPVFSWMNPSFNNMKHLLHGGFEGKKSSEKDIEILFSGNLNAEPDINKIIPHLTEMPVLKSIINQTMDFLLGDGYAFSVRDGLKRVMENFGETWDAQLHYELSSYGVINYIDLYLRYLYRKKTLETLLEAGFSICVVGTGYEELKKTWGDSLITLGSKNIYEVTDLMARSKIVCNPFPPIFKEGAHERIFSAMLNRAMCLTPYTPYQESLFGEHVLFYQINETETLKETLSKFLKNFSHWQTEQAEKTYLYAKSNHTWEKRGEQIIDYYENFLLN